MENRIIASPTDAKARLEKYSSAYTLSDMEVFIFPQLLYALVLANIMSPRLWAWRDLPWFSGMEEFSPEKRAMRLKQYIMDHYTFNLDLETWGLTTKEKELARFSDFVDPDSLRESNALFGYEGDKYYFSIDIRRHFGLDKYTNDIIPYWKTETLEAMDAFAHKPGWQTGGGECVSLACLYAAALFVVARIPLEDIFIYTTPLHSQNFIVIGEGVLTNNRRIVTKAMFFNGSEISQKARRALENERIIVAAHASGYIHYFYDGMSIDPAQYMRFCGNLRSYLTTQLTPELFGNFIRCHLDFQRCFCYRYHAEGGRELYIECEKALRYEESTKLRVSDASRKKLFGMIDRDEYYPHPIPGRLIVNDIEDFLRGGGGKQGDICARLHAEFCSSCQDTCSIVQALREFAHIAPRLPGIAGKTRLAEPPIVLTGDMDRIAIIRALETGRTQNETIDLAFHAARLPGDWFAPYWLAACTRNPICVSLAARYSCLDEVYVALQSFPNESIYDEARLAQPDEVWNYARGDGFEKAVSFAAIALARGQADMRLAKRGGEVTVICAGAEWKFASTKDIGEITWSS
ncbi:MAG: hypothetical protein LBC99_00640 [Spirochaetota bacterium]|jgi:hypothetical protein|nr:hypothetical protein [Spirochaetota bacterium]